jgi:ABC-type transport system involved in multi-copper enzyme maturation permease subunit
LSYPVKRWHLFLSKFLAMFFTFIAVFFAAFSLHIYLGVLGLFEPMFYVGLFVLFLQILLVSAVTVAISLITKREAVSILLSVLLLLGIDNIVGDSSFLSSGGRLRFIFAYLGRLILGEPPFTLESLVVTADDIFMTISVPLFVSAFLLIMSFVYFTRFMEVD